MRRMGVTVETRRLRYHWDWAIRSSCHDRNETLCLRR